ncbi:MAG: hypothetical protein RJQ03_07670, partial [Miltoncostaeaceae bacterium]
ETLVAAPGPGAVASSLFSTAGAPARRRRQSPLGLMLSPAPDRGAAVSGLEAEPTVAGTGAVRIVAGTREPAHRLWFEGDVLHGVSPYVRRTWSGSDLALLSEDRPGGDLADQIPLPVHPDALEAEDLPGAVEAPGGEFLGVSTREARAEVVAILRASDRAIVRWIRGARAIAWSPQGDKLAIGAEWGIVLAVPHTPGG